MKVNILSIDFQRAYEKDEIFMEFSIGDELSDVTNIKVQIYDPFFRKPFAFVEPIVLSCNAGSIYWISFWLRGQTRDPVLGLQGGFIVTFEDLSTNTIILEKEFRNVGRFWTKREVSNNFPWDTPRLYIVGDSHSWTNFGDHTKNIDSVSGLKFIRHVHYGASSHTFWSGDFYGYIGMLPIEDQDIIAFNFGTHDFRKGVFKASDKKNIPLEECIYATLFQTFYRLKQLREVYKKNHFMICSIVPPFREHNIKPENRKEIFWESSDEDRLKVFSIYKNFWSRHIHFLENASFLDWTVPYLDNSGFLIDDYMYLEDIHIEKYEMSYQLLDNHIRSIVTKNSQ